jgi:hypothetical protein
MGKTYLLDSNVVVDIIKGHLFDLGSICTLTEENVR